jgi:hypothetical protein
MVMLWHEVDLDLVYKKLGKNGRISLCYGPEQKPLRFQIPSARCQYGLGQYNTLSLDFSEHQSFINWFGDLEAAIGAPEPFNSNMKNEILRIKVDDSTLFFDWENKMQEPVDLREGLWSNSEIRCIIDISGVYFFNDVYGLTCRMYQMKQKPMSGDPINYASSPKLTSFAFTF